MKNIKQKSPVQFVPIAVACRDGRTNAAVVRLLEVCCTTDQIKRCDHWSFAQAICEEQGDRGPFLFFSKSEILALKQQLNEKVKTPKMLSAVVGV
jgi:hypothetical protein